MRGDTQEDDRAMRAISRAALVAGSDARPYLTWSGAPHAARADA